MSFPLPTLSIRPALQRQLDRRRAHNKLRAYTWRKCEPRLPITTTPIEVMCTPVTLEKFTSSTELITTRPFTEASPCFTEKAVGWNSRWLTVVSPGAAADDLKPLVFSPITSLREASLREHTGLDHHQPVHDVHLEHDEIADDGMSFHSAISIDSTKDHALKPLTVAETQIASSVLEAQLGMVAFARYCKGMRCTYKPGKLKRRLVNTFTELSAVKKARDDANREVDRLRKRVQNFERLKAEREAHSRTAENSRDMAEQLDAMELEKNAAIAELEILKTIEHNRMEDLAASKKEDRRKLRLYMSRADADATHARAELRHERLLSRIIRFSNGFYRQALAKTMAVDNMAP